MKNILDLGPALLFFAAYLLSDIYTATMVLIAALFATVGGYWLWKRELHKPHLAAALIAAVLGGLTLWVRDPMFIKYKPTAVYGVFALVLLLSHVIGEKVLMARLPQTVLQLPELLWKRINFAWALFFILCAVLNIYVAERFDEADWVTFKTFGFTALMFVFLLAHLPFVASYLPQDGEGGR